MSSVHTIFGRIGNVAVTYCVDKGHSSLQVGVKPQWNTQRAGEIQSSSWTIEWMMNWSQLTILQLLNYCSCGNMSEWFESAGVSISWGRHRFCCASRLMFSASSFIRLPARLWDPNVISRLLHQGNDQIKSRSWYIFHEHFFNGFHTDSYLATHAWFYVTSTVKSFVHALAKLMNENGYLNISAPVC